MRTLMIILGGFALLAACLAVARIFAAGSMRSAVILFLLLWLLVAGSNMWVGVTRAGYSVSEELPIFLLIYAVPAIAALIIRWKFLPGG